MIGFVIKAFFFQFLFMLNKNVKRKLSLNLAFSSFFKRSAELDLRKVMKTFREITLVELTYGIYKCLNQLINIDSNGKIYFERSCKFVK